MAQIDKNTIENLSQLSRIHCTKEEQEKILHDLKNILEYIELLQQLDTENVAPCNHVLEDVANVMREDVVGEIMNRDTFLANAPAHIDGLIRVPPIMKTKEV